jgi:hypothetical protein
MQRLQLIDADGTSNILEVQDDRAINIVVDDGTIYTFASVTTVDGEKTAVYRRGTTLDLIDGFLFTPGSNDTATEVDWHFLGED